MNEEEWNGEDSLTFKFITTLYFPLDPTIIDPVMAAHTDAKFSP